LLAALGVAALAPARGREATGQDAVAAQAQTVAAATDEDPILDLQDEAIRGVASSGGQFVPIRHGL
jgi:hypothetical protein